MQTIDKITSNRKAWLNQHSEPYSKEDWQEYNKLFSDKIQNLLDAGDGSCILKNQTISDIIKKALLHFDKKRYDLGAWVIMPNHIHILIKQYDEHPLHSIISRWKSQSARLINRELKRNGTLWMPDYWDRYVRDEQHFMRILAYITNNPLKAHLVTKAEAWPWISDTYSKSH